MPIENKRLLIELERAMKDVNREIINPLLPELNITDLTPIMTMVASARASYLNELCQLSEKFTNGQKLTPELVKNLRFARLIYDELIEASKALDVAIERGYLDVEH
jgi:hypothetical protein